MLILNTPSNPSGAAYSARDLAALGAVLARHPNVLVMTDEIYEHLVYDGFKPASFAAAVPELYDRTITTNGMSKGYVMTGWRLGLLPDRPQSSRPSTRCRARPLGAHQALRRPQPSQP